MKKIALLSLLLILTSARSADYMFRLQGRVSPGQFIGKVIASDPNIGQTLTYAIVAGNTNYAAFKIDAANGNITVNNATFINRRTKTDFYLTVRVTDSGGPNKYGKFVRLSAQAIIHIYRL